MLMLTAGGLLSGCQTSTPEARVAWRRYMKVNHGMTHAEVDRLVPLGVCDSESDGTEHELWIYGNDYSGAGMHVVYGRDHRVRSVERDLW
jgi:hypothetical protein